MSRRRKTSTRSPGRYTPPKAKAGQSGTRTSPDVATAAGTGERSAPAHRDHRARQDRTIALRVAGWLALVCSTILLSVGGFMGFLLFMVFGGVGTYFLVIARERRLRLRSRPHWPRQKLEQSLLVGPWAESWYRRVDAARQTERERHRWRWWVTTTTVVAIAVSIPYGVVTGYGNAFGYNTALLDTANLSRSALLAAVLVGAVWFTRRWAAAHLPVMPRGARFLVRGIAAVLVLNALIVPVAVANQTGRQHSQPGADTPAATRLLRLLGNIPKAAPVRLVPAPLTELARLLGDEQSARYKHQELSDLAGHDLLLLDRQDRSGLVVVFDRTTNEPFSFAPEIATVNPT